MQLVPVRMLELCVLRAAVGGHGGVGAVGVAVVGAAVVVTRKGCVGFIDESGHNHWSHFSLHHFKSLFFFFVVVYYSSLSAGIFLLNNDIFSFGKS